MYIYVWKKLSMFVFTYPSTFHKEISDNKIIGFVLFLSLN